MSRAIWVLTSAIFLVGQGASAPAELPLEPGVYWVYTGYVAWTPPGSTVIQRRPVTWRMVIGEVIEREFAVAAVVTGHPRDLISYEPDRQPRTSLIVRVSGGRHYLVGPERAPDVLQRFRNPADDRVGIVREREVFLQSPIALGQRFCETEFMARSDGLFCWWVDEERNPGDPIIGVPANWDGPEYAMAYRSPSFSEHIGFAPGIGITTYDFSSAGSEVQLKLTEVGHPLLR